MSRRVDEQVDKALKKLKKQTRYAVRESRRILRKYRAKMTSDQLEPLQQALSSHLSAMEMGRIEEARASGQQLEHLLENEFAFARKSAFREWFESLAFALLIALFLRTFVVEAFKIPSGSMIPTLLVGDHIFVNKFVYGIRLPFVGKRVVDWGLPERGEVIVFAYPHDPDKDYIKRVIGLPGDHIEVRGQEVLVNGELVSTSEPKPHFYIDETTGRKRYCVIRDAALGESQFNIIYETDRLHPNLEYTVNPGHLFVMGDNRDNSADSRAWGQVPIDNIKGRAMVVWWSSSEHGGMRFDRIGHLID